MLLVMNVLFEQSLLRFMLLVFGVNGEEDTGKAWFVVVTTLIDAN